MLTLTTILLLLVVAVVPAPLDEDEQRRLALQNPNLFQGDIVGIDPNDRNVLPNPEARWTNKIVPYVIDDSLSEYRDLILEAMTEYHKDTCVRFVPRRFEMHYIRLYSGDGCHSSIGMARRGVQDVSLGPGCRAKGTVIHELGHILGFYHEQNRSDRDDYLNIYWENIKDDRKSQFDVLKPDQNLLLTPFDPHSIMIYGNYAFSVDGRSMTMEAKDGTELLEPYKKEALTASDIKRVNTMYQC